jgi:N-acetylneuraminic acid mutarotase
MKKTLFLSCFMFCMFHLAYAQPGTWTWMHGDTLTNQTGNFGIQGVADSSNRPPALYAPITWTDTQGNFWLYGGMLYAGGADVYGDMWRYNPATNQWTWLHGTGLPNQSSVHGVKGIPSPLNHPGSRSYGAATWVDNSGNFWMFGGLGNDDNGNQGNFNDMWKYDVTTNEWTWMKGPPNAYNNLSHVGTLGVEDTANFPYTTHECTANWIDNNALWYVGGLYGSSQTATNYLWRFNILTNAWTCMKGNNPGNYGVQGVDSSINSPPRRCAYCGFNQSNSFWLFGGNFEFSYQTSYNDMWKYSLPTGNWTWINGSNMQNNGLNVSSLPVCEPRQDTFPSARHENRGCWIDNNGIFWMFGGYRKASPGTSGYRYYDDWWVYNSATDMWAYMDGKISPGLSNYMPHYGTQGVADTLNTPAGRMGFGKWKDAAGNFWIYGGFQFQTGANIERTKADLWKYVPDLQCALLSTVDETIVQTENQLIVFPNPSNTSITISFNASSNQKAEIKIFNTLGVQVYFLKEEMRGGKFEKEINVKHFSNGIYFVQLQAGEHFWSRKIVVEHP